MNKEQYAFAISLALGSHSGYALVNISDGLTATDYINYNYTYKVDEWRGGFISPIIFRNYVPSTVLDTQSIISAGTEIKNKLGFDFISDTPPNVPWNQGDYANRLIFSSNNYGNGFLAASFPYIIKSDGTSVNCLNVNVTYNGGGVYVPNATTNTKNPACYGESINVGHIVFNSATSFSNNIQTHLILHEFSHLFGLNHISSGWIKTSTGYDYNRICDSIMIGSITTCTNPLTVFGARDVDALKCLKSKKNYCP